MEALPELLPPVQTALLDLLALVLAGRTFRRDVALPHRQLLVAAITAGNCSSSRTFRQLLLHIFERVHTGMSSCRAALSPHRQLLAAAVAADSWWPAPLFPAHSPARLADPTGVFSIAAGASWPSPQMRHHRL